MSDAPDCPAAERLVAWAEQSLDSAERTEVARHIDGCERCRIALSELVREERRTPTVFAPGDEAGRYRIVALLGAGAMGVVYEALDTELKRPVALKMVRRGPEVPTDAGLRLREEAQTMARLSHPRVVSVFDAGTFEGDAFVAMELVRGQTLRSWAPRASARARLDACLAAGEGLAAAHAAGVIHRDVKPDNVLVNERDEVKVSDFGLASLHAEGRKFLGTPAYAAPEVLAGTSADARADQFSFCVTVVEVLSGRLPWAVVSGRTLAREETRPLSEFVSAPRGVIRALERGLSVDPLARFSDVDALLAALRCATPPQRKVWFATASVVGLLVLVGVAWWWSGREARACAAAADRVSSVWNSESRTTLTAAFARIGQPWAEAAGRRAIEVLDVEAATWRTSHLDACAATWVARTQSTTLLDARLTCLRAREDELRASVALLLKVDAAMASRAVAIATTPVPNSVCDDGRVLAQFLDDVDLGENSPTVRASYDDALALRTGGRPADSLAAARKVLADVGHNPALEANVRLLIATTTAEVGTSADARERLNEALLAAERARHDRTRLRVLIASAFNEQQWDGFDASKRSAELAHMVLERIGGDPELEARLENTVGARLLRQGDYPGALPHFEHALTLWRSLPTPRNIDAGIALNNLAILYGYLGRLDDAARSITDALELVRTLAGPWHVDYPRFVVTAGAIEHRRAKFDEAAAHFREGVALFEQFAGPEALDLAMAEYHLAVAELDRGHLEAAAETANRALRIAQHHDARGTWVAMTTETLALVAMRKNALTEAAEHWRTVISIRTEKLGAAHLETLNARGNFAMVLNSLGERSAARAELADAMRGVSNPELTLLLRNYRGRVLFDSGEFEACSSDLKFIVESYRGRTDREAWMGGECAFLVARAEWALGRRAAAREWAKTAREAFRAIGDMQPDDVAALETWQRTH